MWTKRTLQKILSLSIQHLSTPEYVALLKKRQGSTGWTGPWCSNVKYPVRLSAEIHTMNIYNSSPFILPVMIAGRRTQLLIDSGASLILINLRLFRTLPRCYRQRARLSPPNLCLQLADRSQLYVKYILSLPITISNSTRVHRAYVVPKLWRCIIGNDLIREHNLQIDGEQQSAYFRMKKRDAQLQQGRKKMIKNEDEYVLRANESVKISSFHVFNTEVKPGKPFSITKEEDGNECEVVSIKRIACVANGIITPREHMTL